MNDLLNEFNKFPNFNGRSSITLEMYKVIISIDVKQCQYYGQKKFISVVIKVIRYYYITKIT